MLSGCITGGPTPTNTPAEMHRSEGVCEQVCSHLLRGDTLHINAIATVKIRGSLNMNESIVEINDDKYSNLFDFFSEVFIYDFFNTEMRKHLDK